MKIDENEEGDEAQISRIPIVNKYRSINPKQNNNNKAFEIINDETYAIIYIYIPYYSLIRFRCILFLLPTYFLSENANNNNKTKQLESYFICVAP